MIRDFAAEELLHCADTLAGRNAGRGRPRTAYLRRATSTAYYALFHHIGQAACRQVVSPLSGQDQEATRRWVAHGEVKRASLWILRRNDAPVAARPLVPKTISRSLTIVATAVIDLQQARHLADYDPAYDADKRRALGHVDQARAAVSAASDLETASDPDFQRFLFLAMAGALAKNT